MAKINALQWIVREAKRLRREYPHRFKQWKEYVAQASAIYASKHKGKSPVGHKHPPKKKSMGKAVRKKASTRKKARPARRRRVGAESGVSTRSRTHTDYNRNKVNITVGAVNKHAKSAREKLQHLIGREEVKKFIAKKKTIKRKIQKKITSYKAAYRRLAAKI